MLVAYEGRIADNSEARVQCHTLHPNEPSRHPTEQELSILATLPGSVEIYCLKCRAKTGSRDVEQVTMKNGRPALRAVCSVCGTGKYRIGSAG